MEHKKRKLRPFLYAACILSAVVGVETVNNTYVLANEEASSVTTLSSENLETVTPSEQVKPSEELSSPVVMNEGMPSSNDENIMNSEGTQPDAQQETTEISIATQNESGHNAFDFNGSRWVKGSNEAYVDLAKNSSEMATHYYTIKFAGNGIDLLAIKSHNHGIVDVYLNDEKHGSVDLYNSHRGRVEAVYSIRDLQEGVHNLRVVSTGENNSANTRARYVNQVVGARIYHAPYRVEDLTFAEEEVTLKVGATKQLAPEVAPSYVTNPRIQYTSHAPEVVSVDSSGLISALKQGNARVTATVDGISKDIHVVVEAAISQMKGSFVDNNLHYTSAEHTQVVNQTQSAHRINVWRNDQANAQISIAAVDSTLKNVRYELTDLVHGETGERLSGAQVTANFIKELSGYRGNAGYHNANKLNIPTTPSISRPDMLLREQSVNVPFNGVQNLWLNVAVPKEAAAGTYRTTVKVYADEISEPMTFDLTVEVANAVLENNNKRFDIELWQYPYRSAEYYGVTPFSEEHFNILRPHLEKYKSIGGNGITASIVEEAWGGQTYADGEVRVPSMIKWLKKIDGTFTFDYTDFDKWVTFAESMGLGDKIVGYSMIPWGNRIVYFDEATNQLATMTLPVDNPQYAPVWKQFLTNFTAHLDSKDWFDKFYMGIDERPRMELAFDVIDAVKNKDGKSLKIAAAANHFSGNFAKVASRIHHLSIGTPHMKSEMAAFKQFVAERNAKGLKTTLYTATEEYPNNLLFNIPGESYFTVLYGAKFNTNGFLRWAFDAWVKTPTTDLSHWAFESGDTQLIYPDEKNAVNPLSRSSVRLEKMAEAVRDVNKLYQIREEVPSLAREIDELLATLNDSYSQHTRHNGLGRQIAREPNDTTRRLISEDVRNFKVKLAEITAKYIDYLATATDELIDDTTGVIVRFNGIDKAKTKRLRVSRVSELPIVPEILNDAEYELFNIYPLSRNNDKVHIVNEAVVRIPIQSNKVVDKVIYLLPETGALEVLPHRVDNNHVEFTVSHFSVYGVIYARSTPPETMPNNPNTDAGTTTPLKDTDAGTPTPPNGTDAGTPTPPKDTDGGTTPPPKDTDAGTSAPPNGTDAGTPTPPKDTDTGTPTPSKDTDADTTPPPKDTDADMSIPPKSTSDDEQHTQTVLDSDGKFRDRKFDSFNQSTQARDEVVETLVATGEEAAYSIFGGAALAILASLGLVPSCRKSEE